MENQKMECSYCQKDLPVGGGKCECIKIEEPTDIDFVGYGVSHMTDNSLWMLMKACLEELDDRRTGR